MNLSALREFCEPYYRDKDIMHNLWHIELVQRQLDKLIVLGNYDVNRERLLYALYFHGFIYSHEKVVREWLQTQQMTIEKTNLIVQLAWESQRPEEPQTLEGKLLHDAHVLEGGKTYAVVKTLITGSVRGQTLPETLRFMKDYVVDQSQCYLPETKVLCEEMNQYTKQFLIDLEEDLPGNY